MFYVMSICKDGGRRIMQNEGENDLHSTIRSYRKGERQAVSSVVAATKPLLIGGGVACNPKIHIDLPWNGLKLAWIASIPS